QRWRKTCARLVRHPVEVLVDEFANAPASELATVAGASDSAEGQACPGDGVLVDEGHAIVKLLSDLAGCVQVGAPHGAGEPVVGGVRELDGRRRGLSAVHDRRGRETLLAA